MSATDTGAERLALELAAAGCSGRVEVRGRLAVLMADAPTSLADAELRDRALRIARALGFTHLALELPDGSDDAAAVHRAQPAS